VLALVTEEVGRHLQADTAVTVRYDAPGLATSVAHWTAPHLPGHLGERNVKMALT
jgi:hypothetical protein